MREIISQEPKEIKAISIVKASDPSQTYTKIMPIFSLKDDVIEGQASYYIGKASGEITAAASFNCKTGTEAAEKCTFLDLDSSKPDAAHTSMSELIFKQENQNTLTTIKKDRYYLALTSNLNLKNKPETITVTKQEDANTSITLSDIKAAVFDHGSNSLWVL